nr:N-acetylmuramoyl-L-alanine amidase [uncultured Porphyromonas sp.]
MRQENIRYIVVHCSATRCTMDYTEEMLERDHRARGFRRAGYHFYIRRSGSIIPLRPLDEVGAHALGYNACSWGVCYEGGLDATGRPADTRTEAQQRSLRLLLSRLHCLAPKSLILGHRDLSPDRDGDGEIEPHEWIKVCPCFDARRAYRLISEGKEVYDA